MAPHPSPRRDRPAHDHTGSGLRPRLGPDRRHRHRGRRPGGGIGRRPPGDRRGHRRRRPHQPRRPSRPAQLPPPLRPPAGHGRVDVALGLAEGLCRPGPPGPDPRDRGHRLAPVLRRRPPGGNHLAHGHVALHGGLGRGRRRARHPGHPGALRRRRPGVRLLRDHRQQPRPSSRRGPTRPAAAGSGPGWAWSTSSTARRRRSGPRPTWPRSSTPASTPIPRRPSGRSRSP